ncbi:hypothetical protein GALMADRAFT_1363213 [Galerina marginata CBS 339.88]|uniref:Uncharacterized protein n=1 Tax=Galerina marginata (strain CBS 339.88) TaxID=685588 RepID=A0A067T7N5_GALM3|nr:hypothetical protein GALMADRAFT_1363213 [Galerina marginata CBS 339.88]
MGSVEIEDIKGEKLNRPSRAGNPAIGNPGALGLFSFGSTTFILSLFNLQTRGIHTPNVVIGMAIFCGGLAQVLAGMWEFPRGNAFGATALTHLSPPAFTSYGAFWMSYATILLPASGILSAYQDEKELANALGIFLSAWFIVTVLIFIASLRKFMGLILLFACLAVTFLLLAAAEFTTTTNAKASLTKAGGATGLVTAFIAFFVGLGGLLAAEEVPVIQLPVGVYKKTN